jgi:hypothetical protein
MLLLINQTHPYPIQDRQQHQTPTPSDRSKLAYCLLQLHTSHKNPPDPYDLETWKKEGPRGYVSGVMSVSLQVIDAKTKGCILYA